MDVMGLFGIALISAALIVTIKKNSPEQAFAISIGCVCVMAIYALRDAAELITAINGIAEIALLDDIDILFKALGISIVAQILSDICSDYGQSSLAGIITLAGRFTIVIMSLPLFSKLLDIALQLATR